jgi:hypothetical protein
MASKFSTDLRGRATVIYQERLKNRLESTNPDDFVAIEPESGDFFLGKTLSEAIQAARAAHPARLPFALRVGHAGATAGLSSSAGQPQKALLDKPAVAPARSGNSLGAVPATISMTRHRSGSST